MDNVIFLDTARGLPVLRRGWRTPDPSPSRGVEKLPGCGTGRWCEKGGESTPRGRSELASKTEPRAISRTPSPLPVQEVEASSALSSSGNDSRSSSLSTDCSEVSKSSTAPAAELCSSEVTWAHDGSTDYSAMWMPQGYVFVPVLTPIYAVEDACAYANWDYTEESSVTSADEGALQLPPPPAPHSSEGLPEGCPSLGSMLHPHSCADFCKYAKKARGCKDGAACVRCHLCTKKRTEVPAQTFGHRRHRQYGRRGS